MNRREFLISSAVSAAIPSIALQAEKPEKPKTIKLIAFCRDVLKVKLDDDELFWAYRISIFGRQYLARLRFRGAECRLVACIALWAAYTHPDNTIWIHESTKDLGWELDLIFEQITPRQCDEAMSRIWPAEYAGMPNAPRIKPDDWHIMI